MDEKRDFAREVGRRLYRGRVAEQAGKPKGFSQPALSKLSGVSQRRISEIESGRFDAAIILQLAALARVMGLTFDALVFGDEPTEVPPVHPHPKHAKRRADDPDVRGSSGRAG